MQGEGGRAHAALAMVTAAPVPPPYRKREVGGSQP